MRAPLLISLALVLLAGCSSSSSSPDGGGPSGPNADSYVGTWTFQSGSIVPNCSISIPAIDLTGEQVTITKTDATHVQMMIAAPDQSVMCDVNFVVSGATAAATSGQTCAIKTNGISAPLMVTTWTLSLSGSQIQMSMMGTANAIVTCNPTSTGTMTKSSSDAG